MFVNGPPLTAKADAGDAREVIPSGFTGTTIVYHAVGYDGFAQDVRIVQAVGYGLDEACMKAVERSRWEPARLNGAPVVEGGWIMTCEVTVN